MEMKSRSQVRRIRSQIKCDHDLAERYTSITDGHCPLCLLTRINELEAKLVIHDKSSYEMVHKVHKEYLAALHKRINELAMNNNHKQYQKQINELSIMVKKLRAKLKFENQKKIIQNLLLDMGKKNENI